MSIDTLIAPIRAGMDAEQTRIQQATTRIAMANTPLRAGQASPFAALAGVAERTVYDPGHAAADAQGMVRYPAVDLVGEMTTLLGASRSYEANVRSFNTLRSMVLKALEIGVQR